jgi:hypothetical protein
MAQKTGLLKVAIDTQDYRLAARVLVYGLLKARCDQIQDRQAREARRNGKARGAKGQP